MNNTENMPLVLGGPGGDYRWALMPNGEVTMPNMDDIFPGPINTEWLDANGYADGVALTIAEVEPAKYQDGDKGLKATFEETPMYLGLNKTNALSVKELAGGSTDYTTWAGTKIALHKEKLPRAFNGHTHAVRIRKPNSDDPTVAAAADMDSEVPF